MSVGPTVNIGSILSPVATGAQVAIGTIGTIQSPVAISGNVPDVGTVGTILSPIAVANVADVGTIGTIQAQLGVTASALPTKYVFLQASATVKGGAGTLSGFIMSGALGGGTVVMLDYGVTPIATIAIAYIGTQQTQPIGFGPGVTFGTLVASLQGGIDVTVLAG
jgi:hypothetical protein